MEHIEYEPYVLVQYMPPAAADDNPIKYTYLIPIERVSRKVLDMLQANNGCVKSEGDYPAPEMDAFLETCQDCKIEGPLELRHNAAISVVCQMF